MASCAPGPGGDATTAKCVPCESLDKSNLLSEDRIREELAVMPLWERKEAGEVRTISRSYVARNFQSAMDSLVAVGEIAEREGHHPDLHVTGYRNVEIVLFTHSLGGISENDIALARMIDAEVEVDYSPKWLKSHPEAKRR